MADDGYRIALRPDHRNPQLLDDVVVNDVEMFRAEDMGDFWWLCCYLTGGDRITWHVRKAGKRVVMETIELPMRDDITYEPPAASPQETE